MGRKSRQATRGRVLIVAVLAAALVGSFGCQPRDKDQARLLPSARSPAAPLAEIGGPTPVHKSPAVRPFAQVSLGAASGECVGPDVGEPVAATVKPYTVSADLKEVSNLRDFAGELDAAARKKLAQNLFVVKPTKLEQLFYILQANEEKGRPSFITLDAVLHLWHMSFDYTLRYLERTSLLSEVGDTTRELLSAALQAYSQAQGDFGRDVAARVVAYFAVPARLLELKDLPDLPAEAERMVAADLQAIEEHSGPSKSAVTGFEVSFDLFKPRGHYTRRPEYRRFFKAMSWYGNAYWAFPDPEDERGAVSAAAAALLWELIEAQGSESKVARQWQHVYEATQWFVGSADDVTPQELGDVVKEVYGPKPSMTELGDRAKATELARTAAQELRAPLNRPRAGDQSFKNVRFMGTRFIPDSYVLRNLVWNRVEKAANGDKRMLPRGLDVFAALGSSRALHHLTSLYKDDRFRGYLDQMKAMHQWLSDQPAERWVSNMYWAWFWVLSAVAEPKGEGFPSFMTTDAWTDKELATALASWAELRHDTILYAKGVMAEGEGPELPPLPKGYVEPDVQAWRRLHTLAELSLRGLIERGLLKEDDDMAQTLGDVRDLIGKLEAVAEKELRGEALTKDEYQMINWVGDMLEGLQLELLRNGEEQWAGRWFEVKKDVERRMGCVADVATGGTKALEVAVGPGYTIYAVCPIEGKLVLARGAVFSYFEFADRASDRLTDEQWNEMLDTGKAPAAPEWQASFLTSLAVPQGKWRAYFSE